MNSGNQNRVAYTLESPKSSFPVRSCFSFSISCLANSDMAFWFYSAPAQFFSHNGTTITAKKSEIMNASWSLCRCVKPNGVQPQAIQRTENKEYCGNGGRFCLAVLQLRVAGRLPKASFAFAKR